MLFMFKKVPRIGLIFCCSLLVLVEFLSLFLVYKSWNNKPVKLDNVILQNFTKNKGLAILIEQEDGTYKESTNNSWPEDMMFNEEKSGCLDSNGKAIENSLTYENGIATIKSNSTSYCYLYFDMIKDDVTIAISTDGVEGTTPSSGAYINSATCSSGNVAWSDKYRRIEIGNLTQPTKCNLTFTKDTSSKILLKTEVESKTTTNENGYRYSGKQPNNWSWFNNEMWRIIGSIPTCLNSSCSTKENMVKIVRAQPIGGLVYDGPTANKTWGTNTLYTLLNEYYYGAKDATGAAPCYGYITSVFSLCNYEEIGIKPDDYYGKMVKEVYWNIGTVDVDSGYTVTQVFSLELSALALGKIGLMNSSDYGYAIGSPSTRLNEYSYNVQSNWIYGQGNESLVNSILYINVDGLIYKNGSTGQFNYLVRPVVYLDSNIFVIEGTGTESDPYIIGM